MARFFELLLAFLMGLFGLGRKRVRGGSRKRPKRATTKPARPPTSRSGRAKPARPAAPTTKRRRRAQTAEGLAEALVAALPTVDHHGPGVWAPAANVGVEDGRVTVDLHGLSEEDAVGIVEEALRVLADAGGAPLRLVTGHGRDRAAGYSRIRVALVDALDGRDDVTIDEIARHRRHRDSDDRLGHMDLLVG